VAITAIDAIVGDVMFMAERNGLRFDDADVGIVRPAIQRVSENEDCAGEEATPNNTHLGYRVGAAVEDLCHA